MVPLVRRQTNPSIWSGGVEAADSVSHHTSDQQRLSSYLSANEDSIASTPIRSPSRLSARSRSPFDFRRTANTSPSAPSEEEAQARTSTGLGAAWARLKAKGKSSAPPSLQPPPASARPSDPGPSHLSTRSSDLPNEPLTRPTPALPTASVRSGASQAKERSPYPPPSSSTGTSGNSFAGRGHVASFRRRSGSGKGSSLPAFAHSELPVASGSTSSTNGSAASRSRPPHSTRSQSMSTSELLHERTPRLQGHLDGNTASSGSVPVSSSTSSLSRFFGTRKKSPSVNADGSHDGVRLGSTYNHEHRHEGSDALSSSPPLAIISSGWTSPKDVDAGGRGALSTPPKPTPSKSSPHQAAASEALAPGPTAHVDADRLAGGMRQLRVPADEGLNRTFAFPAGSTPSTPSVQDIERFDAPRSRARHVPALSAPLSLATAAEQTADASHGRAADRKLVPQRKPTGPHSSRSLSLNKLAAFLGGSTPLASDGSDGSDQEGATGGLSRTVSRRGKSLSRRPSMSDLLHRTGDVPSEIASSDALSKALARKPSLRARLRIPRLSSTGQIDRPTTPEIESWRGRAPAETAQLQHGRRASVDAATQLRQDAPAVKITRSRSMVRRKPPPEFDLDELTSQPLRLGPSEQAPLPELPRSPQAASDPPAQHLPTDTVALQIQNRGARSPNQKAVTDLAVREGHREAHASKIDREKTAPNQLTATRVATAVDLPQAAIQPNHHIPAREPPGRPADSIALSLVHRSGELKVDLNRAPAHTSSYAEPSKAATRAEIALRDEPEARGGVSGETANPPSEYLANEKRITSVAASPALLTVPSTGRSGDRSSPGSPRIQSLADASSDSERPWSLISAGEADTPVLRLRKLVVDTNSPDDRERDDDLFFRPFQSRAEEGRLDADARRARPESPAEQVNQEIMTSSNETRHTRMRSVDKYGHLEEKLDARSVRTLADNERAKSGRTSSASTARSELRHEASSTFSSAHSSGSSTLKPGHFFAPGIKPPPAMASASSSLQSRRVLPSDWHKGAAGRSKDGHVLEPLRRDQPAGLPGPKTHHTGGSSSTLGSLQNARRESVTSRRTSSSGHFSEGVLSEDALSALEAEVGRARRTEVVALGKGSVTEWMGENTQRLTRHEGPTLSRHGSIRRLDEQGGTARADDFSSQMDEEEARRQGRLGPQLQDQLQSLAIDDPGLQKQAGPEGEADESWRDDDDDGMIRDIPDERSSNSAHQQASAPTNNGSPQAAPDSPFDFNTMTKQPKDTKYARLSAFHDRKLPTQTDDSPPAPNTIQFQNDAIRLGRAPSKRVRRYAGDAKSVGEAVMITRDARALRDDVSSRSSGDGTRATQRSSDQSRTRRPTDGTNPKPVSGTSADDCANSDHDKDGEAPSPAEHALQASDPRLTELNHGMRRARSDASDASKSIDATASPVPKSAATAAAAAHLTRRSANTSRREGSGNDDMRKKLQQLEREAIRNPQDSRLQTYLTTEEAIAAKQRERAEREKRHRRREERKQLEQQRKYALKKKSDPLLATRLALAGLQPGLDTFPDAGAGAEEGLLSRLRVAPPGDPAWLFPNEWKEPRAASVLPLESSPFGGSRAPFSDMASEGTRNIGPRSAAGSAGGFLAPSSAAGSSLRTYEHSRYLSAPPSRQGSFVGSVMSFHTAEDVSSEGDFTDPAGDLASSGEGATSAAVEPGPATHKATRSVDEQIAVPDVRRARSGTAASFKTVNSIASSLTADFEFPIPPQRAREQLSDDGTLLSRAGLGESIWGTSYEAGFPSDYRELHQSPTGLGLWNDAAAHPLRGRWTPRGSPLTTGKEVALRRARSVGFHHPRTSPSLTVGLAGLREQGGAGLGIEGLVSVDRAPTRNLARAQGSASAGRETSREMLLTADCPPVPGPLLV